MASSFTSHNVNINLFSTGCTKLDLTRNASYIMLYLVISTPLPTKPSEVRINRQKLWEWAQPLIDQQIIKDRCMYAKVGRGAIALFDVSSHGELNNYISQWLEIIPAEMQIIPLLSQEVTHRFLSDHVT